MMRKEAAQRLLAVKERPEVKAKLDAHLRSDSNPFKQAKNRRKAQITLREKGFPQLNGGNGQKISLPQQLLALRLGWPTEVAVTTGDGWRPHHYKFDIADLTLQIAVEVDGTSHLTARVQKADRRKDQWAKNHGWTLLRYTNKEVLDRLEEIAEEILRIALR